MHLPAQPRFMHIISFDLIAYLLGGKYGRHFWRKSERFEHFSPGNSKVFINVLQENRFDY